METPPRAGILRLSQEYGSTAERDRPMFSFLRRIARIFVRKSTRLSQTPLNTVSLVILIIVDLFVLFNVFGGLDSVSSFPLSPNEEYPCYEDYQTYHGTSNLSPFDRQVNGVTSSLNVLENYNLNPVPNQERRLGSIANLCLDYQTLQQGLNTPEHQDFIDQVKGLENNITIKQGEVSQLQDQYDSTLLEKIAGQDANNSINQSTAEQTKQDIATAQAEISRWQQEIIDTHTALINTEPAVAYLKALGNANTYASLKKGYESADFWYPNLQFLLQLCFLTPLIAIAYGWQSISINRDRGLQTLLSWHLLLIFCVPLVVRLFQFLQFSNLVRWVVDAIVVLVGGLMFIASYLFILVIPLVGFGLIKFLQHFVFNPRVQAKKRIQKQRCLQCNARLKTTDPHCPHCGFNQYQNCHHCHSLTHRYAPFCRVCGEDLGSSAGVGGNG